MKIENSTISDIDEIFKLYKIATDFQKINFPENQWPEFERDLIANEIFEKQQWKMVLDNQIACIWAVNFSDPQIWEEKNADPAIYIHRIAANPNFRGQKFVTKIVAWAKEYAFLKNKLFIRMDTCGDNKRLIKYYENSGFDFLGISKLKSAEGLPCHYKNADVCFFEIKLNEK